MHSRQGKLIETLERVADFLTTNRDLLQGVITSAAHQNFLASRSRMVEHMNAQEAQARASRASTAKKHTLRDRLFHTHMQPIAIVARVRQRDVGGLSALTVPRRTVQVARLVTAAYRMAHTAKVHEQAFLTAGLPPGFVESLVAATDALRDAISAREHTNELRVRATDGLRKEARVARTHLRLLDALVRAGVDADSGLRARWAQASRVAPAARSARPAGETAGSEGSGPAGITKAPALTLVGA